MSDQPEHRNDRYDVASIHAYAANLLTLFNDLMEGGMTREEALAVVKHFMSAASSN